MLWLLVLIPIQTQVTKCDTQQNEKIRENGLVLKMALHEWIIRIISHETFPPQQCGPCAWCLRTQSGQASVVLLEERSSRVTKLGTQGHL